MAQTPGRARVNGYRVWSGQVRSGESGQRGYVRSEARGQVIFSQSYIQTLVSCDKIKQITNTSTLYQPSSHNIISRHYDQHYHQHYRPVQWMTNTPWWLTVLNVYTAMYVPNIHIYVPALSRQEGGGRTMPSMPCGSSSVSPDWRTHLAWPEAMNWSMIT